MELPSSITNAVDQFRKLSGIGEKSAMRHVLDVVKWRKEYIQEFADSLRKISEIKTCELCNLYSDTEICSICSKIDRIESKSLCIVENVSDLVAIERSKTFSGTYFVLNGVLNPLLGVGPEDLKIDKLMNLIKDRHVESIILAINPSVEGDATCSYIQSILPEEVTIERIGFGVPMGGSLEYLDSLTIRKAIENRRRF